MLCFSGGNIHMKKHKLRAILVVEVLYVFVLVAFSPAQSLLNLYVSDEFTDSLRLLPNRNNKQEMLVGQRIDDQYLNQGYVEHMTDAIARDRFLQSKAPDDESPRHGSWVVPPIDIPTYPYSGKQSVINTWGDTLMGITFSTTVNVLGAWFAGCGKNKQSWADGVRVHGYQSGEQVSTTTWFKDFDATPSWFAMNLYSVDRIVIEVQPVLNQGGWFCMDDLTYLPGTMRTSKDSNPIVVDFEDCPIAQDLSTSGYAGLIWEPGTGSVYTDADAIHDSSIVSSSTTLLHASADHAYSATSQQTLLGAPTLLNDFQGVIRGDATSWSYPPDSCGAAGPNHFVEVVNRNFAVYDKTTGEELINILLGAFLPGSNGDPRVLYDQYSDRWFVIVCDFTSQIYLAVSRSDDPTGDWFKCSFIVSQGSDAGKWPDYPTLGVDEDGVYTAAYMIGGSSGMSIFALEKASLIASEPSIGDIFAFRELPWEGAIQPVHSFGAVDGEYFVSRASATSLRLRKLTGLLTTPVLSELGYVSIPSHGEPPDAPALGSTTPLDTVGTRLMNAVYRDGCIWTAHCIGLNNRAASRWYKIDVSSVSLADYGTIQDPVLYYFFPTIMVNAEGDAIMGFSGSCSGQYAAAYYTGRLASDPPGVMAPPVLLKAGEATYNLIDSYGRNRWGDYSLCSLDPVKQTLWTIQEYAHSHNDTGVNRWGTWIGELAFNQPPLIPTVPDGPDEGITGVSCSFTTCTTDPEEEDVFYRFDWGDGNIGDWLGPFPSGTIGTGAHAWVDAGVFEVRAQAKDVMGGQSAWSEPHMITVEELPVLEIRTINGNLGHIVVTIKNVGTVNASNISWSIVLDGGFMLLGKQSMGSIPLLKPGVTGDFQSRFIFGFGKPMVRVVVEVAGVRFEQNASAMVVLFFVTVQ